MSSNLPCEQPCPKCGSRDIYRQWIPGGNGMLPPNYETLTGDRCPTSSHLVTCNHDRIRHHCRCCQFEWDQRLAKNKQPAEATKEKA